MHLLLAALIAVQSPLTLIPTRNPNDRVLHEETNEDGYTYRYGVVGDSLWTFAEIEGGNELVRFAMHRAPMMHCDLIIAINGELLIHVFPVLRDFSQPWMWFTYDVEGGCRDNWDPRTTMIEVSWPAKGKRFMTYFEYMYETPQGGYSNAAKLVIEYLADTYAVGLDDVDEIIRQTAEFTLPHLVPDEEDDVPDWDADPVPPPLRDVESPCVTEMILDHYNAIDRWAPQVCEDIFNNCVGDHADRYEGYPPLGCGDEWKQPGDCRSLLQNFDCWPDYEPCSPGNCLIATMATGIAGMAALVECGLEGTVSDTPSAACLGIAAAAGLGAAAMGEYCGGRYRWPRD